MMDRGTVRNMQSFIPKINLRNYCIQLVLLQEFNTKHGHLNAKFSTDMLLLGLLLAYVWNFLLLSTLNQSDLTSEFNSVIKFVEAELQYFAPYFKKIYNTTDHKTHFMSGVNCYMFRHQGAINREFINDKFSLVQQVFQVLFKLISIIKVLKC